VITSTLGLDLEFYVDPLSIVAGQNYQTVALKSDYACKIVFTRICFTYILIDILSFNQTISYYVSSVYTTTFPSYYNNLMIPAKFNPYAALQCLIGLKYFRPHYINYATSIDVIDSGSTGNTNFSSIAATNFHQVTFSTFCVQECPYSYVDYANSTYICNPCSSISNCLTCVSASNCTRCLANYFLLNNSACYSTCPNGYFGDNVSSMCIKCCTDCLICLNSYSCLKCSTGKPI
jgi:hypothetical protein